MKKKQVSQKPQNTQKPKKKPQQQSGVQDLATYEEDEMNSMFQQNNFNVMRKPIQREVIDDDEEVEYNIDDIKNSAEKKQNQDKMAEIVLSLFHKNKINDKNAFDIPLINIKDLSVFQQTEGGDNAWKQISANLDAGSKIYGYRVDMVHQNTYKVLGGIHRTTTNFDEEQEQVQGKEEEQEQIKKRRIVNTGGEATLEKNLANLDTNKYDLEFEIDPLFQQTSAKFDEAGAKGLLLNNLSISENLVLALDSELLHEATRKEAPVVHTTFNPEILNTLRNNLRTIIQSELCPELAQFRADIMQRGYELFDKKHLGTTFNDVMRNQPKLPMDEQDEYIMDDQQDEQMFMQEVEMMAGDQEQPNHRVALETPAPADAFQYQEHEDFDDAQQHSQSMMPPPPINRNFNLAQFEGAVQQIGTGKIFNSDNERMEWMNLDMGGKNLKKKASGAADKKPSKLKKKQELPFSFMQHERIDRSVMQKKPKEEYLSNYDLKQLFLLPRSHYVGNENFLELFQRHIIFGSGQGQIREDIQEQQLEVVDDYDMGGGQQVEQLEVPAVPGYVPGYAGQFAIDKFANQRQTIPIKELKVKMWASLNQRIPYTNQKEGILFSQVAASLPQILQVPETKMKVSVQTCFVTLLHLANEENLRLLPQQDQSDFQIQKELIEKTNI